MAKLLWLDLETTGLNPESDVILEVATVITDGRLDEICRYHSVIHQVDPTLLTMSHWCKKNHDDSGLIDLVRASTVSEAQAEQELLSQISRHVQSGDQLILAGSSIHFDRAFIRNRWKRLDSRLHYRMIDVSSIKESLRLYFGYERQSAPPKHRAEKDIDGSIAEFRDYMKLMRVPQ